MKADSMAKRRNRIRGGALLLITAGVLAACGKELPEETDGGRTVQTENIEDGEEEALQRAGEDSVKEQIISDADLMTEAGEEAAAVDGGTAGEPDRDEIKDRFGENCISEQTFEVDLSEYDGKVWFVPYTPAGEEQELTIQIVQDGEVLTQLYPHVPEKLKGQPFTSLDSVSFFDINYDNYTDIVLIETYGNSTFADVYYGFDAAGDDYEKNFYAYDSFSENISNRVEELTVSEIRDYLSEGKKNGGFSNYQEAYRSVLRWCEVEYGPELTCDLIYVDEGDIPELTVGQEGYWISMYTYAGGRVYTLMDHWAYGAMGNAGYEYIPYENRMRNYNSDYAGAILSTTYMKLTFHDPDILLDVSAQIKTYQFDDVNGNGIPDEDEEDSMGRYSVSYVDGVEITNEQYDAYNAGEYKYISGGMSLEEIYKHL